MVLYIINTVSALRLSLLFANQMRKTKAVIEENSKLAQLDWNTTGGLILIAYQHCCKKTSAGTLLFWITESSAPTTALGLNRILWFGSLILSVIFIKHIK